jgi:hypothetical protein
VCRLLVWTGVDTLLAVRRLDSGCAADEDGCIDVLTELQLNFAAAAPIASVTGALPHTLTFAGIRRLENGSLL